VKRLFQATRAAHDERERCDLCAEPIAADHEHLYEARARAVRCACEACAVIVPSSETSPYRRVPRRFERLGDAAQWVEALGVPVGIAALIRREAGAVVAYPGPVGLVESEVDAAVLAAIPEAAGLAVEVEALVWSTLPGGGVWRCGIDVVFRMVSELRAAWVGMAGGPEVPAAVARMFAELANRSELRA